MRYLVGLCVSLAVISAGCNKQQNKVEQAPPPEVAAPAAESPKLQPVEPIGPATAGPSSLDERPMSLVPAAPSAHNGKTYTVQKGDTFYSIARKLYGKATKAKVDEIMALNPGVSPKGLKPGQVLTVP